MTSILRDPENIEFLIMNIIFVILLKFLNYIAKLKQKIIIIYLLSFIGFYFLYPIIMIIWFVFMMYEKNSVVPISDRFVFVLLFMPQYLILSLMGIRGLRSSVRKAAPWTITRGGLFIVTLGMVWTLWLLEGFDGRPDNE